jgi:two-component system OmpR family response regulator
MLSMPHLLLVDDDEDILSLLTGFFRKHGYTVSVAEDGAQMFAALQTSSIDLVILDVMLKREDGFSLCRLIRATSAVPIIMLTAMADHTDRVVGLEVGADDYLTKPFDQRELLARVKAVLRRSATNSPACCFALPSGAWMWQRASSDRPTMRSSFCQEVNLSCC